MNLSHIILSKECTTMLLYQTGKLAVALNGVFSRSITVGNDDVSFMAINNKADKGTLRSLVSMLVY